MHEHTIPIAECPLDEAAAELAPEIPCTARTPLPRCLARCGVAAAAANSTGAESLASCLACEPYSRGTCLCPRCKAQRLEVVACLQQAIHPGSASVIDVAALPLDMAVMLLAFIRAQRDGRQSYLRLDDAKATARLGPTRTCGAMLLTTLLDAELIGYAPLPPDPAAVGDAELRAAEAQVGLMASGRDYVGAGSWIARTEDLTSLETALIQRLEALAPTQADLDAVASLKREWAIALCMRQIDESPAAREIDQDAAFDAAARIVDKLTLGHALGVTRRVLGYAEWRIANGKDSVDSAYEGVPHLMVLFADSHLSRQALADWKPVRDNSSLTFAMQLMPQLRPRASDFHPA